MHTCKHYQILSKEFPKGFVYCPCFCTLFVCMSYLLRLTTSSPKSFDCQTTSNAQLQIWFATLSSRKSLNFYLHCVKPYTLKMSLTIIILYCITMCWQFQQRDARYKKLNNDGSNGGEGGATMKGRTAI